MVSPLYWFSFSVTLVSKSSLTSDMLHRAFHWSKCKITLSFVVTVSSFQNRKSTLLDPFHSVNSKYILPPRARLSGWTSTIWADICKMSSICAVSGVCEPSCVGGIYTISWVAGTCTIYAVGGISTISIICGILVCCSVIWLFYLFDLACCGSSQ
jgi:hypothetical protein